MAHEKDTLIAVVLDKSGSMASLRPSTITGFNAFLDEQRAADDAGEAFVSFTLFDTGFDVRYVGEPLEQIPALGTPTNQYTTGGGTALYDAVGVTVKGAEQWVVNRDFGGKVIVVIMTDGEENSSREWHIYPDANPEDAKDINNLIQYKQNEGWEFVFLGAGQSAWLESRKFSSIAPTHTVAYMADAHSNTGTYAGVSSTLRSARIANSAGSDFSYAASLADTTSGVRVDEPPVVVEHQGRTTSGKPSKKSGGKKA